MHRPGHRLAPNRAVLRLAAPRALHGRQQDRADGAARVAGRQRRHGRRHVFLFHGVAWGWGGEGGLAGGGADGRGGLAGGEGECVPGLEGGWGRESGDALVCWSVEVAGADCAS